jgi:hypothetical protein
VICGAKKKRRKSLNFTEMKKSVILLGLTGVVIISLLSCAKGGAADSSDSGGSTHYYAPNDSVAPVLEITTPVTDQVITSGNTINVTGKITDETGLYRGSIRITNDANGELQKEQLYEIHGLLDYSFNMSYATLVTTASNYTITVWFEDHGLNRTTKTVKIKVNP